MSSQPKRLCIISSHRDSEQVEELIKRIRPLEERKAIEIWYLDTVPPGMDVQLYLTTFLPQADCVLIWISPELWNKGELYALFSQNIAQLAPHVLIIPLLARHAVWESDVFLKSYESNIIPFDRQPLPTDSMERRDEWLTTTANTIATKMGILSRKRPKTIAFWLKWSFWAWFIPVIIGIVALFFAYPSFVADSRENNKHAAQKTKTLPSVLECDFPVHFDSTQLFILITRFEDNLNKENETGCYGRGIARRIDEIKNRDNLPIKICYQDSLSPTLSDEAERLREFYHADIIVWGNLQNDSNCESDGFCLKFQPSDTLRRYAGGKITPKVDNEYQPNISAMDLEAGLISMGKESFDAWLLGISNLKIGRKKPEFYRISPDWPAEKQAEEYGKRANMFFQLGVLEKTIEDYTQAIRLRPTYLIYYKRGVSYAKLGDHEKAVLDFNKATILKPDDANIYYNRGKSLRFLGRHIEGFADLEKVLQLDPNYAGVYLIRGVAKDKAGLYKEAISDYDKAIKINPNDVNLYICRAAAKSKLRLHNEAILDYDKIIQMDSNKMRLYNAYQNRGAEKYELSMYQESIKDLDKAIEIDPKQANAYITRGYSNHYLDNNKSAITDFNRAFQIDSNIFKTADFYAPRGYSKHKLKQNLEAIEDLDKAIQLDSVNAYPYKVRGSAYNELGKHTAAISDFDNAIRLRPQDFDAYVLRGIAKNGLGQYEAAIADFNKAVQIKSNLFIYRDRGYAKRKLGKFKEAIADFDIAIKNKPKNADCHYNRGLAYWNNGNYFSALSDFWSAFRLQYLPGWLMITVLVLASLLLYLRYRKPDKTAIKKIKQTEKPAVHNIAPKSKKRRKK